MLYFNSDLTLLNPQQLVDAGIVKVEPARRGQPAQSAEAAFEAWRDSDDPVAKRFKEISAETDPTKKRQLPTFNILALQKIGQLENTPFHDELWLGKSIQWWAFVLLFIGFIIKVPSVPFHTWLPDAHVEAPTPISMILAGILLKMGGYGIIRICYPICPAAGYELAYVVSLIGVVSMVWGAFAALAQNDFKRMVAYSSVSHMGYVVLGLGVWSLGMWTASDAGSFTYNPSFWKMGANAAMFQMIGHGISSAGMFFCVGVLYDRVHHRNLNEFGGIFRRMPVYAGFAVAIFFAGLGLPGLCGFIGEFFVVLSSWKFSQVLAIVSAFVVILTAGYILWAVQRVYLGAEYRGPHGEALTPMTMREAVIAVPLVVFAIVLGVYPQSVFNYMQDSVDRQVEQLADWTERYDADRAALRDSLKEDDKQVAAAGL
jgi:NADH-quinone oxidoreductase subunit M